MADNKSVRIPMLTNDAEIETLKKAFAENDELLISIRALLLGFPIKKSEADVIEATFKDKNVREAFRKKLYPILSPTSLIGQGGDYWYGTDTEILGRDPDTIAQMVNSKHKVLETLEQAMDLLENPISGKKILLSIEDTKTDPFQVALLARNKYINAVGTALSMIKAVAGLKNETVEETKRRLMTDSSK